MKKILELIVLFVIIIAALTVYYFYKETGGFEKYYNSIEVTVNDTVIESESSGNEFVLRNTYVFKMTDKIRDSIEYELEIIPINNLKYKIGSNYYSFSNIENLAKYFSIEKHLDSFNLKALKTIPELISEAENIDMKDIDFSMYDENTEYLKIQLNVNRAKKYTYSFRIKELV